MTFINYFFLPALGASLIPILLYLFSRIKLPTVPFPSLVFLQRLEKEESKRLRWRQFLLLLLRALAVAALVLVFARPILPSAQSTGARGAAEVVMLVDEGAHSQVYAPQGAIFHQQKDLLKAFLELAQPEDRITLISLTQPRKRETSVGTSLSPLYDWNSQWEPSPLPLRLYEALQIADSILEFSSRPNREIWIVSPFYTSLWEDMTYIPGNGRLVLLAVGPDQVENLAIKDVRLRSTLLMPGKPIEIEIQIANGGKRAVSDAVVSIYVDSERVTQVSADIPAGSHRIVTTTVKIDRGGIHSGWASLEDMDGLSWDNRFYFVLPMPERLKVAVISPPGQEQQAIKTALKSAGDLFEITESDPLRWEALPLEKFDLFILNGVTLVSPSAQERLVRLVSQGVGVILFPAYEMDLTTAIRGLWGRLGFRGATGVHPGKGLTWGKIDLDHPLFEGVFEKKEPPTSPRINWTLNLVAGEEDKIIIPLADGSPFLIERRLDKGKALLFSISLNLESSNFIYTGIFAPLIIRSALWSVALKGEIIQGWSAGPPQIVSVGNEAGEEMTWRTPDGEVIRTPVESKPWGREILTPTLDRLGIWSLDRNGHLINIWPVNLPGIEASLQRTNLEKLEKEAKATILYVEKPNDLSRYLRDLRLGKELWTSFWGAFMGFLIAESFLGRARRKRKER
ncbi:MAG: BatA domain-containing protein [bacterium]